MNLSLDSKKPATKRRSYSTADRDSSAKYVGHRYVKATRLLDTSIDQSDTFVGHFDRLKRHVCWTLRSIKAIRMFDTSIDQSDTHVGHFDRSKRHVCWTLRSIKATRMLDTSIDQSDTHVGLFDRSKRHACLACVFVEAQCSRSWLRT